MNSMNTAFSIRDMSTDALKSLEARMQSRYDAFCDMGLSLDMSRGKPSHEQVALSQKMLDLPGSNCSELISDGVNAANYGTLMGLPSCRRLFAELLGVEYDQVFIGGSSSLNMMYDTIAKAYTHGLLHSEKPWSKYDKVKFICLTPGYDRHFTICESFGMEMIPVPLKEDGPDMNMVESLIRDPEVRGMWCVPKYSNPDGTVYSDEVIERIASMRPAAPDFLLMWDNAYCVHEFDGEFVPFRNMLAVCAEHGNADMVFEFASTSKITFPGAGVSCFACSTANMDYMKKLYNAQTISYDKLNQLRHVMFFKNAQGVLEHMKRHAKLLKPRFDTVLETFESELSGMDIATWKTPVGGYFISLEVMPGTAKEIHALCKKAGLTLTNAGATYPHGDDPNDSNLRIAPSYPTVDELKKASELLCICIKLVALKRLISEKVNA